MDDTQRYLRLHRKRIAKVLSDSRQKTLERIDRLLALGKKSSIRIK